MTFATDMYNAGVDLLSEYGASITVTRDVVGSYNPSNGTVTDSSDTTYTGYGLPTRYNRGEIDGTIVQQGDIRLVFTSATTPLVNDLIPVDGVTYTALNVQKISTQSTNVIYIVQLRV